MVSRKQMEKFRREVADGTVQELVRQGYTNGQLMQRYNVGRTTLVKHCGNLLNKTYRTGGSRNELIEVCRLEDSSPARLLAMTLPWR